MLVIDLMFVISFLKLIFKKIYFLYLRHLNTLIHNLIYFFPVICFLGEL